MNRSFLLAVFVTHSFCCGEAWAWGGEHERITAAAIEALPQRDREDIGLEKTALVNLYCTFPDMNWPCYGEWGGGVGDPQLPRFPDTRREWEISFYCGWDPVLRQGQPYVHAPPPSWAAAAALFQKAVAALQEGRHEDGMRFLGATLHYVQDSGSFPHIQPMHRNFHVRHPEAIRAGSFTPQVLGLNPEAVANRVRELVQWTEQRTVALWRDAGLALDEARQLAARETLPARVVEAVNRMRAEKTAEFEIAALNCANECVRACAEIIQTVLTLARQRNTPATPASGAKRPAFNPSFEDDDGDGVPDGWCVGWLDLQDHAGRAERYRAGTHWDKHVRTGQFSVLILRAPAKGLEWRPTWRRASRVNPGDKCRGAVWAQTRAVTGRTCLALEFYDAAYQPISRACSGSLSSDQAWGQLSVEAAAPANARWLRPILWSQANTGAVWFDDLELALTTTR